MGLVRTLAQRRFQNATLANPPGWLVDWFNGGPASSAGPRVTAATARTATAVWCAVLVLASTISTLPLIVYRRLPDGGKERDDSHPLAKLLHDQPNPWQTIVEWLDMTVGHLELRGNAYSVPKYDGRGTVTQLVPLHPDRVRPFDPRTEQNGITEPIAYEYTPNTGGVRIFFKEDLLHLFGHSDDGLVGLSTIAVHRESIGKSLALQEYGARFFGNYAAPGGVLTHPKKLGKEGRAALKEAWEAKHMGLENAHRVAVLEEGMKWEKIGVDNKDSQYLEAMEFGVDEVARIFNVPPHKLHELRRSTNNNIEHQAIEFVQDAIRPRCVRIEKRLKTQLFKEREQATHFCEFNIDGLLRGDFKSRMDGYHIGRIDGIFSADEIRARENMNPQPDGNGHKYWMPVNYTTTDKPVAQGGPAPTEPEPQDPLMAPREAMVGPTARMLQDALDRVLSKELKAVRGAVEKHATSPDALRAWLTEFYGQHAAFVQRVVSSTFLSCGEVLAATVAGEWGPKAQVQLASHNARMAACAASFATRYTILHRDSLLATVGSVSGLVALLESYEQHTARTLAEAETRRLLNAAALFAYEDLAFVQRVRWNAPAEGCPSCTLGGTIVAKGEEFTPSIKHPPAAAGCRCWLVGLEHPERTSGRRRTT